MITHYKVRSGQVWQETDWYDLEHLTVWFQHCCRQIRDYSPEIGVSQRDSTVLFILWHKSFHKQAYMFESELQAAVALKVLQQIRKGMSDEPKA